MCMPMSMPSWFVKEISRQSPRFARMTSGWIGSSRRPGVTRRVPSAVRMALIWERSAYILPTGSKSPCRSSGIVTLIASTWYERRGAPAGQGLPGSAARACCGRPASAARRQAAASAPSRTARRRPGEEAMEAREASVCVMCWSAVDVAEVRLGSPVDLAKVDEEGRRPGGVVVPQRQPLAVARDDEDERRLDGGAGLEASGGHGRGAHEDRPERATHHDVELVRRVGLDAVGQVLDRRADLELELARRDVAADAVGRPGQGLRAEPGLALDPVDRDGAEARRDHRADRVALPHGDLDLLRVAADQAGGDHAADQRRERGDRHHEDDDPVGAHAGHRFAVFALEGWASGPPAGGFAILIVRLSVTRRRLALFPACTAMASRVPALSVLSWAAVRRLRNTFHFPGLSVRTGSTRRATLFDVLPLTRTAFRTMRATFASAAAWNATVMDPVLEMLATARLRRGVLTVGVEGGAGGGAIVKPAGAGGPRLPAVSVAVTTRLWLPTPRPLATKGLLHRAAAAPSRLQSVTALTSLAANVIVAVEPETLTPENTTPGPVVSTVNPIRAIGGWNVARLRSSKRWAPSVSGP